MAKKKRKDHETKIAAAAQLAAQGLDQTAIGKRLGVSQAGVSRLLYEAQADTRKWLVRTPQYCRDRVPPQIHAAARQEICTHDLAKDFHDVLGDIPLREVFVFDSGGTGTSEEQYRTRLSVFGLRSGHSSRTTFPSRRCRGDLLGWHTAARDSWTG